jgi:radical SAM superfamily enzyme YgiQ (UPF0313 family)
MKIALGNLVHKTIGRHSAFMPINIAYIASYILDNIFDIEVRIYDDFDKIMKDINEWDPDVVALSNYCWNSELSYSLFKYIKNNNLNILTVAGGPDFPENYDECEKYLLNRKDIDFYVYGEGEKAFLNLINKYLNLKNINNLKQKKIDGLMFIDPFSKNIIVGDKIERFKKLDVIPSPYLNGLMDSWFDGYHIPSLETTRGCPFSCQYCHTGNKYYNSISKFSINRIKEELNYITKKMSGYSDILLSICDTNFGMYERDEEIIDHILYLQKIYNWPLSFDVTTGKSNYDKILNMIKRLGGEMRFDFAIQSLNYNTLNFIKRKNPSLKEIKRIQSKAINNDIVSLVELIMPLPEETKSTFLKGLKNIMNSGVEYACPYTTMMLKGTGLSKAENRKKYNMKTKFRIIPARGGSKSIPNKNIIDLNGAIYMGRWKIFYKNKDYYNQNTYAYILPQERSLDIDSYFDLKIAKFLLKNR